VVLRLFEAHAGIIVQGLTSTEQQEKHQCHFAVMQHMQGSKDPAAVEQQEKH
jgi:hypothetical protein